MLHPAVRLAADHRGVVRGLLWRAALSAEPPARPVLASVDFQATQDGPVDHERESRCLDDEMHWVARGAWTEIEVTEIKVLVLE